MKILSGGISLRLRARLRGELPGLILLHAGDAAELWAILKRETIDAVILDERILTGPPVEFLSQTGFPERMFTVFLARKRLSVQAIRGLLKPGANISVLHAPVQSEDLIRLVTLELGLSRSRTAGSRPQPAQPGLEKVWNEQVGVMRQRLESLEKLAEGSSIPVLRQALSCARQLACDLGSFGIYRATLAARTLSHLVLNALAGEALDRKQCRRLARALRELLEKGIAVEGGSRPTILLASQDCKFGQNLLGECRLLGWDLRSFRTLAELVEAADGPDIHALLVDASRPEMLLDSGAYQDIISDPLASFVIASEAVPGLGRNHYWLSNRQTAYQMLMAVARAQAGPVAIRPPLILHWDEDRVTRALASELLTQADLSVKSVQFAHEFWTEMEREPPSLILLSLHLPQMNGLEVTRALRLDENTCHFPVVLLSEYSDSLSQMQAYEAGVDDVILKPFSPRQLISRVSNRLALSKARQNLVDLTPEPSRLFARLDQLFLRAHRQSLPVQLTYLRQTRANEERLRSCHLQLRQVLRGEDVIRRVTSDGLLVACLTITGDSSRRRIEGVIAGFADEFRMSRAVYPQDAEDFPAILELLQTRAQQ